MKFKLGNIVITSGCLNWMSANAIDPLPFYRRHASGDWEDLSDEDKQLNERALETGERLLSVYSLRGQKLYVITEWDRSVTTMLLAEEYQRVGFAQGIILRPEGFFVGRHKLIV